MPKRDVPSPLTRSTFSGPPSGRRRRPVGRDAAHRAVHDIRRVRGETRWRARSSRPPALAAADLVVAFVLYMTIAFSAAVSWASYAADFSRYLPSDSSHARVFGFILAGIVLAYIFIQGIGIAAGDVLAEHTAAGVRSVMGGGLLGGLALIVDRAGGDRVGRDDRLQRIAGATDHRGPGAPASVCRRCNGAGVRADPVAGRRPHRDAFSGCAVAGELLDPGVRRGGGHRLADSDPADGRPSTPPKNPLAAPTPRQRSSLSFSLTPRLSRS